MGAGARPPSLPGGIDLQECDAGTLSCLLRIVESKASPSVCLAQACDLFSAVEYCLADKLRDLLFDYLEPMVAELTAKEVRAIAAWRGRCAQREIIHRSAL
ncbi:MAG: hypothetical protein HC767_03560 [Akkermansiaceae bacterium]|nr:hypothetical protein [Akkermansiaceae bacterium]